MGEKFLCPVCDEYEFEKMGDYEICPVCGWENDRVQAMDPDFEGGANALSLNQARAKYQEENR